jgi:hypothetical protein
MNNLTDDFWELNLILSESFILFWNLNRESLMIVG